MKFEEKKLRFMNILYKSIKGSLMKSVSSYVIAEKAGISKNECTTLVQTLEEEGLLNIGKADKKSGHEVFLTPKGKKWHNSTTRRLQKDADKILEENSVSSKSEEE